MAEETQSQETQSQESQQSGNESADEFWKTHEKKTRAILDSWFDAKVKEHQGTGTSRTGGRPTLPGIIADIMFGKENQK